MSSHFYIGTDDPTLEITDSGTLRTKVGSSHFYHDNDAVHMHSIARRHRTITGSVYTQAGLSNFYSKPSLAELQFSPPYILESKLPKDNRDSVDVLVHKTTVKFPQMKEFSHFHYDKVHIGTIQVYIDRRREVKLNSLYEVIVNSNGSQWVTHRSFHDFTVLDDQIHYCVFDRKFSNLPVIKECSAQNITQVISDYLMRFSELSGNIVNCGTVLNFFELDSNGSHLISSMNESAINIPAIAAAKVIKTYRKKDVDELELKVGDFVSVIDMPPRSESLWWRGKKGLEVGFFPGHCVEVIGPTTRRTSFKQRPTSEPIPVMSSRDKIKQLLRHFLKHRPERVKLKQSGIVQERVFGTDLGEHVVSSTLLVPRIVTVCTEAIERHGIIDGIYRLSGGAARIQIIREEFDECRKTNITDEDILDVHAIASVLKTYFRELPNPLLTFALYKPFVDATKIKDTSKQLALVKIYLKQLPPPHFRTAAVLFGHLSRMSQYSKRTGMTARNLAIVWAPNVLRYDEGCGPLTGPELLNSISLTAAVTDMLITNYHALFPEQNPYESALMSKKPSLFPLGNRLVNLSVARKLAAGRAQLTNSQAQYGVLSRNKSMSNESFFESKTPKALNLAPVSLRVSGTTIISEDEEEGIYEDPESMHPAPPPNINVTSTDNNPAEESDDYHDPSLIHGSAFTARNKRTGLRPSAMCFGSNQELVFSSRASSMTDDSTYEKALSYCGSDRDLSTYDSEAVLNVPLTLPEVTAAAASEQPSVSNAERHLVPRRPAPPAPRPRTIPVQKEEHVYMNITHDMLPPEAFKENSLYVGADSLGQKLPSSSTGSSMNDPPQSPPVPTMRRSKIPVTSEATTSSSSQYEHLASPGTPRLYDLPSPQECRASTNTTTTTRTTQSNSDYENMSVFSPTSPPPVPSISDLVIYRSRLSDHTSRSSKALSDSNVLELLNHSWKDGTGHPPIKLAFSNPGSNDDAVRVPSYLLNRLSVDSN